MERSYGTINKHNTLTDLAFELLDELYFITNFEKLNQVIQLDEPQLKIELWHLIELEWVICFQGEVEMNISLVDFDSNFKKYHYIASKKGLLAHNTL
jgi:hypothetical protein